MSTNRDIIDLLNPEFYVGDPHPAYRWMRKNEPVFRDEKNALWGITTMADLRHVERTSDLFISSQGYRSINHPAEDAMIKKDDPGHAEQRKLVSARFTPRAVRGREDEIREIVVGCLERIRSRGSAEVINSLAARIPATLTCRLLGFPDSHWSLLDDWSAKLMRVDRLPFPSGASSSDEFGPEDWLYVVPGPGFGNHAKGDRAVAPPGLYVGQKALKRSFFAGSSFGNIPFGSVVKHLVFRKAIEHWAECHLQARQVNTIYR